MIEIIENIDHLDSIKKNLYMLINKLEKNLKIKRNTNKERFKRNKDITLENKLQDKDKNYRILEISLSKKEENKDRTKMKKYRQNPRIIKKKKNKKIIKIGTLEKKNH